MPQRDWRTNIALGVLAPFIVVVGYVVTQLASGGDVPNCKRTDPKTGYAATNPKNATISESIYHQLACHNATDQKHEKCQAWRQAEAAEEQACLVRYQFWIGSLIAIAGLVGLFGTLAYTADAAKAAAESADAANTSLVASQRAWIRRDRISFASSLEFHSSGVLVSSIAFAFTNVGNAPALHINEFAWLLTAASGVPVEERATKLFDRVRKHPVSGGYTLFAGQAYPRAHDIRIHHSIHLAKAELDAATDDAGRVATLYLATCINYAFSSDPHRNHQTKCLFEIVPTTRPFITRGDTIPETELRLMEGFGGMDMAD